MSHNDARPEESNSTSPPKFVISSLDVHVLPQCKKNIKTIAFKVDDFTKEIQKPVSSGHYQEVFDHPLDVLVESKIIVTCHFSRSLFHSGDVSISLGPDDVLSGAGEEKDGTRVFCKTEKGIKFSIGIQSLPSTVREIVASCSRFRVLIIGESGAGKSSLINKVFGVDDVHVSDDTRGRASIEQEYVTQDNDHFVVHDSRGFEAADSNNLDAARKFISNRRGMRNLKDQLHAVWLCLEVPYANGRVVAHGVETFLREKREILGDVPLVVVFTKLDLLDSMLSAEALKSGEHLDKNTVKKQRQELLDKHCLRPVRKAGGSQLSHVAVSVTKGYEDTLVALIGETTKNIKTYIKDEAALYIATIAQRVNISIKVSLTIAVGEKRYWKALRSSQHFRGHTMKECLDVIHDDIVTIWNFKDPDKYLLQDGIKEKLLEAPEFRVQGTEDPRTAVFSMINKLVAIDANMAIFIPVAVITAPAAPIVLLKRMVRNVYNTSPDAVKQLMAYIVDLTCIMQVIFLLTNVRRSGTGAVTAEAVGKAMTAYDEGHRRSVHGDIKAFPLHPTILPGKRDEILEKIKELILKYRVSDEQVVELRRRLTVAY